MGHRIAALEAGGRTLAVLAGGLSAIYPPEHVELAEQVAANGALISETPMMMEPQRGMFHARNRLISGLAIAVVIIEANDRSGALITARHAAEQGRDLFAVPANVDSAHSAGSLRLLRDGAKLIRDVDDLLEDLKGLRTSDADCKRSLVDCRAIPHPRRNSIPCNNAFGTSSRSRGIRMKSRAAWAWRQAKSANYS